MRSNQLSYASVLERNKLYHKVLKCQVLISAPKDNFSLLCDPSVDKRLGRI